MIRTIFKGWHMSWFPWPKRLKGNNHTFTIAIEKPEMWKYRFLDSNAVYHYAIVTKFRVNSRAPEIYDLDQWDWNKLIGIKKNFFQPRKNSVMVGWRYNPVNDCVEFVPYWHDENGGAHFDYEPLCIPSNELDEPLRIIFRKSYVDIDNAHRGKGWGLPDNAYIGTGWMINPWFGGQQKAQKKITFLIENT